MRPLSPRALLTGLVLLLSACAVQAGDVFLGITMSDITPSMARALQLDDDEGVLIDEVVPDSPAAAGGIEAGDVIVAIDGYEVAGTRGLTKVIHRFEPDDEVEITVLREGRRRDLDITLGEREKHVVKVWTDKDDQKKAWTWSRDKDDTGASVFHWSGEDGDHKIVIGGFGLGSDRGFLGIVPESIEEGEGEDLGLRNDHGVLIGELVDDGPAGEAGLREGDVIVALDDESIADGDELHDFLSDTEPGETISVRVIRNGRKREYEVELGETPDRIELSELVVPGYSQPRFYSGTVAPDVEIVDLTREREEFEEMKRELEKMKEELQAMRDELEQKKDQ